MLHPHSHHITVQGFQLRRGFHGVSTAPDFNVDMVYGKVPLPFQHHTQESVHD